MKWLYWKEYHVNHVIVFALLLFIIVPHMFGLYGMIWDRIHSHRHASDNWQNILGAASLFGFIVSQLALAMAGGNAIAGERVDRSAEFQASLPISRKKILAAKILFALTIAAIIWLTNPPIMLILGIKAPGDIHKFALHIFINVTIIGLVFFCVAWLFSAIINSPAIATVAGLITPMIIWSIICFIEYLYENKFNDSAMEIAELCYRVICLTTALACFGLGTWLYLRRVEP